MRAFIAIELPDAVHRQLGGIADRLRAAGVKATWVHPERMHLTLRFLGDVDGEQVLTIADSLCRQYAALEPFPLVAEGLGAFPSIRRPSVIWAGIAPLEPDLLRAQTCAERAAQRAGLPAESKPFHPHITLARVRNPAAAKQLGEAIQSVPLFRSDAFDVSHVSLFFSELTSRGPVYTRAHEFPMK